MKIMFRINLNFVKKEDYVCRRKTGIICFGIFHFYRGKPVVVFAEHRPMMKIMFRINLNFVIKENYVCRRKTGLVGLSSVLAYFTFCTLPNRGNHTCCRKTYDEDKCFHVNACQNVVILTQPKKLMSCRPKHLIKYLYMFTNATFPAIPGLHHRILLFYSRDSKHGKHKL